MNKMAKRYKQAYNTVFQQLPYWKQQAVIEDAANSNTNSRVMVEFASEVVKVAENEEISLTE